MAGPWSAAIRLNALEVRASRRRFSAPTGRSSGSVIRRPMAQAIEIIRSAQQPDGTWLQGQPHSGRVWFEVDVPAGEPSKWLTLSATRVLAWWDAR